ncbi:MAG: hypothetical protein ACI31C_07115 [Muribaculaceae bacterium]
MEKYVKIFISVLLLLLPLLLKAQDCNDAYRRGVTLRQTTTIEAQNKAITHFAEAFRCFTDDADKDRCLRQITICQNTITRLGGTFDPAHIDELLYAAPEEETAVDPEPVNNDTITPEQEPQPTQDPADIISQSFSIEFEYNDAGSKPVEGLCVTTIHANVTDKPDWIADVIFTRDGNVLIQVAENISDKERSSSIVIEEPGYQYVIQVLQRPKKRFLGIF